MFATDKVSKIKVHLLTELINSGVNSLISGLTQLSQGFKGTRHQKFRRATWKHLDVLVARSNNLTAVCV